MNDKEKIINFIYDKLDYHWDKLDNRENELNYIHKGIISYLLMILYEMTDIFTMWEYIIKKSVLKGGKQ